MAIAFVQDIFSEAENVATLDAVFGTNVAAGNFLVLGSAIYDADNTNPTPTGGGTWSTTTAPTQQNTSNAHICHCVNATGGATTVTYAPGAGAYLSINAAEFSGIVTSAAIDKQTSNGSASSTTPTSGTTAATAQAGELVIAVLCVAAVPVAGGFGIDVPATTGYTNIEVKQRDTGALDANGFSMDYKIVSATGTQDAAWGTLSAAKPWIGKIATFNAAAAGSGSWLTRNYWWDNY